MDCITDVSRLQIMITEHSGASHYFQSDPNVEDLWSEEPRCFLIFRPKGNYVTFLKRGFVDRADEADGEYIHRVNIYNGYGLIMMNSPADRTENSSKSKIDPQLKSTPILGVRSEVSSRPRNNLNNLIIHSKSICCQKIFSNKRTDSPTNSANYLFYSRLNSPSKINTDFDQIKRHFKFPPNLGARIEDLNERLKALNAKKLNVYLNKNSKTLKLSGKGRFCTEKQAAFSRNKLELINSIPRNPRRIESSKEILQTKSENCKGSQRRNLRSVLNILGKLNLNDYARTTSQGGYCLWKFLMWSFIFATFIVHGGALRCLKCNSLVDGDCIAGRGAAVTCNDTERYCAVLAGYLGLKEGAALVVIRACSPVDLTNRCHFVSAITKSAGDARARDNQSTNAGTRGDRDAKAGTRGDRDANAGTLGDRDANARARDNQSANAGTRGDRDANAGTRGDRDANAGTRGDRDANAGTRDNRGTNAGTRISKDSSSVNCYRTCQSDLCNVHLMPYLASSGHFSGAPAFREGGLGFIACFVMMSLAVQILLIKR
ncbi:uncharacterized protein LOC108678151 [Hyalella azteca]|uniref:Uncharacterized protein LOC108678151 n=1 Tax=Hyalella azteca TaxID=294128 RepID=A0A8B7P747_HYAAZ|nr:uncharacterized protein LOC108678151 [Hyalella azteca]